MKEIAVIGMGYIGLPTATLVAHHGYKVYGIDINSQVVSQINNAILPFHEPGLEELLKVAVKQNHLIASSVVVNAECYLIVVPTPFDQNNKPDTSYVKNAIRSILPYLDEGDLVIIESTCPVGTTKKMMEFIYESKPELKDKLYMSYCPERVIPGNIVKELVDNDRVIGGINDKSADRAAKFYKTFVKGELHTTNSQTAEMCKLVENSSRDIQIALANELSIICDKSNINIWELIELANKHPRVNILKPGCGVGGHCIAVDPYFIIADHPNDTKLIGAARKINNYKALWCIEKIHNTFLNFEKINNKKAKLAFMGLAFKPDVDDLRESPASYITSQVLDLLPIQNHLVVEPNLSEHELYDLVDYDIAINEADIIIYLVAHKEFQSSQIHPNKIVLDFCGVNQNI